MGWFAAPSTLQVLYTLRDCRAKGASALEWNEVTVRSSTEIIFQQTPRAAVKSSELQAQLNAAQEDLKKSNEHLVKAEKEKEIGSSRPLRRWKSYLSHLKKLHPETHNEENGDLTDSEKDYDLLPKVVEFSEENGHGGEGVSKEEEQELPVSANEENIVLNDKFEKIESPKPENVNGKLKEEKRLFC
ncbi:WEB family protein, chloroplastic [Trifolium repens]|nr:WEB family protein, chloroplastic [Trifolium repens]